MSLAAGRPSRAAVPSDGTAAGLIRETHAGTVVAADHVAAIARALRDLTEHHNHHSVTPSIELPEDLGDRFSRRAQGSAELRREIAG